MHVVVVMTGNQHMREYHVRKRITMKGRFYISGNKYHFYSVDADGNESDKPFSLTYLSNEHLHTLKCLEELMQVEGVEEISSFSDYSFSVSIGKAFNFDEVNQAVLYCIRKMYGEESSAITFEYVKEVDHYHD